MRTRCCSSDRCRSTRNPICSGGNATVRPKESSQDSTRRSKAKNCTVFSPPQEKAANLLYQVVKDHPFSDGNKRCAAALFVYFLNGNGILGDDDSRLVESNALAVMTLMIALSAPAEKDTMIALVENFLIRHESQEIN